MLTILGVGTGRFSSLTMQGYELLCSAKTVILQTACIPLAQELKRRQIAFETLDICYEQAEDFDELQERVRLYLEKYADALLCIVGDLYTNTLVRSILQFRKAELIPGMGFGSEALSLCTKEIGQSRVLCASAYEFMQTEYTGLGALVVTEIDSPYLAADIVLKLMRYFSEDHGVFIVQHGKKQLYTIKKLCFWKDWDYSSVLVVPEQCITKKEGYTFEDFCRIMDILLGENGCDWDKAQTHESLRIHLIEECYEVIEAIDQNDPFMLSDELGDLLMQIVIHAKIAQKHGEFDIQDVSTEISRKMIRRHPRVFGQAEDETLSWEDLKRKEKPWNTYSEALKNIPQAMTALVRTEKIFKKANSLKIFSIELKQIWDELSDLACRLRNSAGQEKEELGGDFLFMTVALLSMMGINAETALIGACNRWIKNMEKTEELARMEGQDLAKIGKSTFEKLWQKAKSVK